MNHGEIVSFIWGVADLIRDTFKRGKYQDVILPLTVLRRLDCVLAPTKEKVLQTLAKYKGKGLENPDPLLRKASGFAFYNTSRYDFEKLLADAPNVAANLRNYIKGFSRNMQEVIERFEFDNTISKLQDAGLLFKVLERFKNVDLHPARVPNPMMGTIFEELIRRFNEALNENGQAVKRAGLKLTAPLQKAILSALSERDETAEVCRDKDGHPEPDPELRDTENVPLGEDIQAYFEREVKPYVPDAWINMAVRDRKDGGVGKVGYEINFNRYFYQYQPPRPIEEIEADIKGLEREILGMLREVAGPEGSVN